MAEFYMDNGIDPGDPDSLDAFMGGLEHGHSGGAYMHAAMHYLAEDEEYDGFGNHDGPHCGGKAEPGSFGRKWRAVVQGKFRVQARNPEENYEHFDLFPSELFHEEVACHKAAEQSHPKRSIVETRATLKFTGMGDKRNWVWYVPVKRDDSCTIVILGFDGKPVWTKYTDEEGVERKPIFAGITQPDMISFWSRDMFTFDPTQRQETGQEAEDNFWCAAVLWYHFGTSGNAAYDGRFNSEREAFQRCSSNSSGGAATAGAATAAAAAAGGPEEAAPSAAAAAAGGGSSRSRGTVLRWNSRGFGFIKPDGDEGGVDLFCHSTGIADGDMLVAGSVVEFSKQYDASKGKYRAENVTGGSTDAKVGGNGTGYAGGYHGNGRH